MIKFTGIFLILLGALALIYQFVPQVLTTSHLLPTTMRIQTETETIPLAPLISNACIAIGFAALCLCLGKSSRRSNKIVLPIKYVEHNALS